MIKSIITLAIGIIAMIILQFSKKNKKISFLKKQIKDNALETVQEFLNIKDIRKNFLYTDDNKIFAYVRVHPIDINLLSKKEQRSKANILTKEISALQRVFKFLAISKATDISLIIEDYQEILMTSTDQIQKEILRKEMLAISDFASSGEAMERQFYITIFDDYEEGVESEIFKVAEDFVSAFNSIEMKAEILKEKDIYQLCGLVNNPGYISEDIDFNPSMLLFEN